jgi:hypothetical protein
MSNSEPELNNAIFAALHMSALYKADMAERQLVPQHLLSASRNALRRRGDPTRGRNVWFWHKADMPVAVTNVCFRG